MWKQLVGCQERQRHCDFNNSMVYFIQHKTFYVETQSIQNFCITSGNGATVY